MLHLEAHRRSLTAAEESKDRRDDAWPEPLLHRRTVRIERHENESAERCSAERVEALATSADRDEARCIWELREEPVVVVFPPVVLAAHPSCLAAWSVSEERMTVGADVEEGAYPPCAAADQERCSDEFSRHEAARFFELVERREAMPATSEEDVDLTPVILCVVVRARREHVWKARVREPHGDNDAYTRIGPTSPLTTARPSG
jgi:hypothetical protein